MIEALIRADIDKEQRIATRSTGVLESSINDTSPTGVANPGTSLDGTNAAPAASTTEELTEFEYVEPIVENNEKPTPLIREYLNPFPNQTPVALLSRPVMMEDTGEFGDAPIHSNLFTQWFDANEEILKTFTYFRCDFRVKILVRSSASFYGYGLAGWCYGPHTTKHEATGGADIFNVSTADSYFLDWAGSDSCEMYIPFLYPVEYFDRNALATYATVYTYSALKAAISTG